MKILAIVVTYFPEKELLEKNISAFIDHVDKVLIWENTPEEQKLLYRFIVHPKIEYCGDGVNSISHALNYAWGYAVTYGYDYLLTMDQDSVFEDFKQYLDNSLYNNSLPKGVWGPNISSKEIPAKKLCDDSYWEFKSPLGMITSGMLLHQSIISQLGGWNESFAIDCVDQELSLKARRMGVKIFTINSILNHHLGSPKEMNFLGHRVRLLNYSPLRYYSIFHNNIRLIKMYPEEVYFKEFFICYWIGSIKWILLFEKHRIKKLYYIFKGILCGYLDNKSWFGCRCEFEKK